MEMLACLTCYIQMIDGRPSSGFVFLLGLATWTKFLLHQWNKELCGWLEALLLESLS